MKPGIQTSEFLALIISIAVQEANKFFSINLSATDIAGFLIPAIIYILGRTYLKSGTGAPSSTPSP